MRSRESVPVTAQRQPAAAPHPHAAAPAAYPKGTARHKELQMAIDQSPRMVAQRSALQAAFGIAFQRQTVGTESSSKTNTESQEAAFAPVNRTGMPGPLKAGLEALSGLDLSDVRVHRNSNQPAQLEALAYAQGSDIHLAPGQEQHLPHEAWHVVQQRQGRVRPTRQIAGVGVNDDTALEMEADRMGAHAAQQPGAPGTELPRQDPVSQLTRADIPTVGQLLLGTTVVQAKGSGGEKIAFDFVNESDDENIKTGIQLVRESWANAKKKRHDSKTEWMEENIEGDEYKHISTSSATTSYAQSLEGIGEEKTLFLAELKPGLTFAEDTNAISYKGGDMDEAVQVATLLVGAKAAYEKHSEASSALPRATFHKKGLEESKTASGDAKEYVDDNKGVKTRRYAYIEKNYYQMMDFFKTEKMTGRFQQYMQAGGVSVGPEKSTSKASDQVVSGGGTADLNEVQIAVAHQMLGSSPEQRGVSLTSTEKVGGTVGNAGKNFRDKDGFRLKIDLAKVPDDVLFINHYSDQGIISKDLPKEGVKGVSTKVISPPKKPYKYGASVRKNREVYLEHVKPEWVVEIEHHSEGGYGRASGAKIALTDLDSFRDQATNYEEYWHAFDKTLKGATLKEPVSEAQKKGKQSATLVNAGYNQGILKKPPVSAEEAHKEVSGDELLKKEYSQWHLGYIRGRVGGKKFESSEEYAAAMKGT
jgi:hypothetical protein